MKSEIPADMWQLECERVSHKLKLPNIQDTKEWRNHLEQTKHYHSQLKTNLPDVRHKLEQVSEFLGNELERIGKKEMFINKNFGDIVRIGWNIERKLQGSSEQAQGNLDGLQWA